MIRHLIASTTSGPSVSVHGWVAWIIIAAALVASIVVIWKCIWPITKAAVQFSEQWSQITDPDTGFVALVGDVKDLKERTKRIEGKVEDILADGRDIGPKP